MVAIRNSGSVVFSSLTAIELYSKKSWPKKGGCNINLPAKEGWLLGAPNGDLLKAVEQYFFDFYKISYNNIIVEYSCFYIFWWILTSFCFWKIKKFI